MNKISVIIPAYNAAKTVERTVRNVLASTIPLDVYVVDDGSTDGTADVLDKLASTLNPQPSTINIIHQKNQGAYMARLNALKRIKTPWFGFVDADDTIEPDMFEKMLALAENENCDVVQCGVDGVPEFELGKWYLKIISQLPTDSQCSTCSPWLIKNRQEIEDRIIKPHLINGQGSSFIWNKIYRNQYDFSKFATFERLTNYDDLIFNFQFFEKVESIGFLPEKLYHYALTTNGACHSFSARKFDDFCACMRFRRSQNALASWWIVVNFKNYALSIIRARMNVSEKVAWLFKLLKAARDYR